MRYFKKKNKQPKIDKDLCIDVIQKLAEKVMNNIEYISFDYIDISMDGSTPLNSYYCWSGEDNYKAFWKWIGNYLKSITEKKHIKDVFKVYTDYEPCDAFVICVNNSDKKRYRELLAKYNCDTPYEIEPKWGEIIDKCCGSEVHPKDVDFLLGVMKIESFMKCLLNLVICIFNSEMITL